MGGKSRVKIIPLRRGAKRIIRVAGPERDVLPAWIGGNPAEWLRPRLAAARLEGIISVCGSSLVLDCSEWGVHAFEFGVVEGCDWTDERARRVFHVPQPAEMEILTEGRVSLCRTWSI